MRSRKGQMSPGIVEFILICAIVLFAVMSAIDLFDGNIFNLFDAGNHTKMFTQKNNTTGTSSTRTQIDPLSTDTTF